MIYAEAFAFVRVGCWGYMQAAQVLARMKTGAGRIIITVGLRPRGGVAPSDQLSEQNRGHPKQDVPDRNESDKNEGRGRSKRVRLTRCRVYSCPGSLQRKTRYLVTATLTFMFEPQNVRSLQSVVAMVILQKNAQCRRTKDSSINNKMKLHVVLPLFDIFYSVPNYKQNAAEFPLP